MRRPKDEKEAKNVNITELARMIGKSREHVSRNYEKWGFKPLPQHKSPTIPIAQVEQYLRGELKPEPEPISEAEAHRRAKEAAEYADKGLPWPPEHI